jgi:anaerobic selenocysteine-containing dehydrogenase
MSVHHAVCPLDCADTCSLAVEVDAGRVQQVRGSDTNPFTRGRICSKVARSLPSQVHGPDRLTRPLERQGGRFRAISWERALDTIHERFSGITGQHGAEAIVPMSYGGPMGLLAGGSMDKRFFNRLGATRVNAEPLCAGISSAAYASLFGDAGGIPYTELAESRLIVVWGNNITLCNLHLTKILRQARAGGARLVVVDPKRIRIADEADLHLPLRPGTDVVLAYAVAAELERRGALDTGFIEQHVEGAAAYLAEAANYSLQDAAEICGLELAAIEQFVAYWATLAPAAISMGVAPERNRNGGSGIRAAYALPVLTGNIGPRGAGICDVSGYFPLRREALEREELAVAERREFSILDLPERILDTTLSPPVQALFIYNHNPVAVHPRQSLMRQALTRDDLFVVGSDVSMTDSMALADIVLPACTHLEYADVYKAYGHHYLQRSEPVIAPVGEALPNTEIFRRLAARFGFADPAFRDDDLTLIDAAVDPAHPALKGRSASDLQPGEAVDMTAGAVTLLRGEMPDTPSGRIELYSRALEEACGQGLPRFLPIPGEGRLVLVSPSSEHRTNSTFGGIEGQDTDLVAELNPVDADGLVDGQPVRLFNRQGEVVLPVKLSDRPRPGTVYVPKGAWLRGSETGQTINALIPGHKADLAGGACYNDTRVDLEPAVGAD